MKSIKIIIFVFMILALSMCASKNKQNIDPSQSQHKDEKPQYEQVLSGKKLQAGLGFVDLITVFDTPADMYDLLGTPYEDIEFPFNYFYEDGSFHITFIAEFTRKDMDFRLDMINLTYDPEGLLQTEKGIKLGDTRDKAIETYGDDYNEYTDGIVYHSLGIGFFVDEQNMIEELLIFRVPKPELPKWLEPAQHTGKLTSYNVLEMQIQIPSGWQEIVFQENVIAGYDTPDKTASLLLSKAYEDRNFTFESYVFLEEAIFVEENFIPEKDRWLTQDILTHFNANQGYISQSVAQGEKRTYMLMLEKTRYPEHNYQNFYYTVSLDITLDTLDLHIEPDETEAALVSAIMRSVHLDGPLIPQLNNREPIESDAKKILPCLKEIINVCVFNRIDLLCDHVLDFRKAYDENIIQPLDPQIDDHLEEALDIQMEISSFLMAQNYSISYLGTEEDDVLWYGLEITNVLDQKIILGFVTYEDRYLLGDID